MRVGFIGLGRMGAGMAGNLVRAGHDVTVYNRTPAKTQDLVAKGARAARELADACHGDAVITMLSDDAAVEAVVFGDNGLLASLGDTTVHVSMSTVSLKLVDRLTESHAKASRRFITAPVFGRPSAAAEAKLFIFAGGEPDVIDSCKPLFEAMGQKTVRAGDDPKDASLVKLSGNFLTASVIEALGEAMALIGKAGIDRHHFLELLTSTIYPGPPFTNFGPLIAERKFTPAGFTVPLAEKDIRLALAAAESLRVPMPLLSLLHNRLLTLMAQGGEQLDWTAISQLASKDAGVV